MAAPKKRKLSNSFDEELAAQLQAEEEADSPINEPKPSFQRTLTQMMHAKHGREVTSEFKKKAKIDNKKFGSSYRVKGDDHEFGGSGKDEMVSTATTREHIEALRKANVASLDVEKEIGELSSVRVNTDALVWHQGPNDVVGHPGALRKKAFGQASIVGDHNIRDVARATAVKTEFQALVPDLSTATAADVQQAHKQMMVRAQVETVRNFSQPQEQFAQLGRPGSKALHVRYGDISNAGPYGQMADYVHNEREKQKWQAAKRMMEDKHLAPHVPDLHQEYLKKFGDQVAAQHAFEKAVSTGQEKRFNNATSSQAHPIPTNETLRGRAGRATTHGERALSPPRGRRG